MGVISIKRGLTLPIRGVPEQVIDEGKPVQRVALLGQDYHGLRPDLQVAEGDRVKTGQVLFTDRRRSGICFTSPGCGRISAVYRGDRRMLLSLVVELDGVKEISFKAHTRARLPILRREQVVGELLKSGLWASLRTRPLSVIADPGKSPHSLFVTAMDTQPLAPDIGKILSGHEEYFRAGLTVLSKLTDGKLYVCKRQGAEIPTENEGSISVQEFAGPHPAGNPGTHIHFLDPVYRGSEVWYIGAQDVVAVGFLFLTGTLMTERIISLAGPEVKNPRLLRTRLGASVNDLVSGELKPGFRRCISGSVFNGHTASGELAFLGRYHQQISVLPERKRPVFLGWLDPGFELHSVKNIVASKLIPGKRFDYTTALHGSMRAIVPIGSYEKVMPLDILPTPLLRALAVGDIDEAEKLGALELDEEDLALLTYVCPSKIDHGRALRNVLTQFEEELL